MVHTSTYLKQALDRMSEPKMARDAKGGDLPVQLAGRRPLLRSDDSTPSRHRLVTQSADLSLMFNCCNAAFEGISWSGSSSNVSFEKLPGELAFDLISPKSKRRLGRVGLAKDIGSPFLERVEFPDDWLLADEHGVLRASFIEYGVMLIDGAAAIVVRDRDGVWGLCCPGT